MALQATDAFSIALGVKSGFSMYGPTFLMTCARATRSRGDAIFPKFKLRNHAESRTLSGMLSLSNSWSISRNLPAFESNDLPAGST